MAELTQATEATLDSPVAGWVRSLNVAAKAGLVLLLATALLSPDLGHLRDKAAFARAVGYPAVAFALTVAWLVRWRHRAFPWLADLLITLTCFSDILGNRLDLYDSIVWFDDWMHFANTGLLTAAVIMLTLPAGATLGATVERGLAFGVTAALAWEIAEYFAFVRISTELPSAYADTLGDLGLGTAGAVVAALVMYAWRRHPDAATASTARPSKEHAPAPRDDDDRRTAAVDRVR
jgi:hypothetical protein